MNKLLIVLLAVCLVSVHAFVKRDAPAAAPSSPSADIQQQFEKIAASAKSFGDNVHAFVKRDAPAANNNYMETLQKQMEEFAKTVNNQMSQAFDPDTIKKNFNELVDNATKTTR
ncbi:unnamed protein product [Spodoptera littoralis]|uniref:Uncharacterized protein n=1 Tax=Spodoptera littoralis TaxID=7109 RepID=A0A9P0HWM7_SPOLI|nr:unnamed protein product [Spodoptera littoralis]CAH1635756.1 unnamed protein product [Spodoptera littoralis]